LTNQSTSYRIFPSWNISAPEQLGLTGAAHESSVVVAREQLGVLMLDRPAYRYAIIGLAGGVGVFLVGASVIAAVGHEVPKELWTFGSSLGGGLLGVLVPRPEATPGSKAVAESAIIQGAAAQAASTQAGAEAGEGRQAAQEAAEQVKQGGKDLTNAIDAAAGAPVAGAAGGALAAAHDSTARELSARASLAEGPEQENLQAQARVYRAAAAAASDPQSQQAAEAAAQSAPDGQVKIADYVAKLAPATFVFIVTLTVGTLLTVGFIAPEKVYQAAAIHLGNGLIAIATAAGGALVGVLAPSPAQTKPSGS
jgi:hypothetical protein